MKHVIDRPVDINIFGHVVLDEFELLDVNVFDIGDGSRRQIVHANNFVPFFEQIFTDVGSEKTGSAGDK
jgi:hypothetical protein